MNFAETNDEESKLLMAHYNTNDVASDVWFVDSGCSNHMSGMKAMFKELDETQKLIVKLSDRPKTWCVKYTPMCASARVAPSNIVYQWYGYRSTGTGVLNTKIFFLDII